MSTKVLHADYFVIGAGDIGLSFVDTLLSNDTSCTVIIADLQCKPGGDWNTVPAFHSLDTSPEFYGVESRKLEGAHKDDILAYYRAVMQSFTKTGRVRYFPKHIVSEDGTRLTSLMNADISFEVHVTRKVVNATCSLPRVPDGRIVAVHKEDSASMLPPRALTEIAQAPSMYVVIGAGTMSVRTVLYLLSCGVAPEKVMWVRPRDFYFERWEAFYACQDFKKTVHKYFTCIATSLSAEELFDSLEDAGFVSRIDMEHPAGGYRVFRLSDREIDALRGVENVIRKGYVHSVSQGHMRLDGGVVATHTDALYIDCTGCRSKATPMPIWQDGTIKLQRIRESADFSICHSAAIIARTEVKLGHDDKTKNAICTVSPYIDTVCDWLATHMSSLLVSQRDNYKLSIVERAWRVKCRLSLFSKARFADMPDTPDDEALVRCGENIDAMMRKFRDASQRRSADCIGAWAESPTQ